MENASKALIIAGAILISILIIAIGMYIYTNSESSIRNATSQMSTQEKSAFNQTWYTYEGNQLGSNCRTLIAQIISSNSTNVNEAGKLISLKVEGEKVTPEVNSIKSDEMTELRNTIDLRHTYKVTTNQNEETGLVDEIVITY